MCLLKHSPLFFFLSWIGGWGQGLCRGPCPHRRTFACIYPAAYLPFTDKERELSGGESHMRHHWRPFLSLPPSSQTAHQVCPPNALFSFFRPNCWVTWYHLLSQQKAPQGLGEDKVGLGLFVCLFCFCNHYLLSKSKLLDWKGCCQAPLLVSGTGSGSAPSPFSPAGRRAGGEDLLEAWQLGFGLLWGLGPKPAYHQPAST